MIEKVSRSAQTVSDPEILGGEPVFRGTRVPVRSLFVYLEHGSTIDEFLQEFPGVHQGQVVSVLRDACQAILDHADCA